MKYLRQRTHEMPKITIHPLDSGYLVKIGCVRIAVESFQDLMDNLAQYLLVPNKTTQKFNSSVNSYRSKNGLLREMFIATSGDNPKVVKGFKSSGTVQGRMASAKSNLNGTRPDLIIVDDIEEKKDDPAQMELWTQEFLRKEGRK